MIDDKISLSKKLLKSSLSLKPSIRYSTGLPWSEKYRPKKFEDIISHKEVIKSLKNFIKKKNLPHLLLYGPPGTGKTSIISSFINELYGSNSIYMTLFINASEDRGISTIRNKITDFAKSKSLIANDNKFTEKFKIIILDEADSMTHDAQSNLRKVMEIYSTKVRFCLICNYIKKINIAIKSRCVCFNFIPLCVSDIEDKIHDIIVKENVNITYDGIQTIIKRSNGDLRKLLNMLQSLYMQKIKISATDVDDLLHYPSKHIMDIIYDKLLNSTFNDAYEFILKTFIDGYDILHIITELTEMVIINNDIDLCKFLKMFGTIEYNLHLRTPDKINIVAIVGAFKICIIKKLKK